MNCFHLQSPCRQKIDAPPHSEEPNTGMRSHVDLHMVPWDSFRISDCRPVCPEPAVDPPVEPALETPGKPPVELAVEPAVNRRM